MGNQEKQINWLEQWKIFKDDELFLFKDWIKPATIEDFRGKSVLECGCGGGQHTSFMAPYAESITAVDLNTVDIAIERNAIFENVEFLEADIATMKLNQQFDFVLCIGVIHHTDDPDQTFINLYDHCKPGGIIIIWTYSAEGNFLVRFIVEPLRKMFLRKLPTGALVYLSKILTLILYPFVYSIYLLPFFSFLPYFDYFNNFRRLAFKRNVLNVFDKLNAPQTKFTTINKCQEWFNVDRFKKDTININQYAGVSYTLYGVKK